MTNDSEALCEVDETDLDQFVAHYWECALWSSMDEDGRPLEESFGIEDVHEETMRESIEDCKAFLESNAQDIGDRIERAAHDFWLTRNRHGAGFWDGDWPDDVGDRLTKDSHAYGEVNLYVGDDGKVHVF